MSIATANDFYAVLEKSKLLSSEQLEKARQETTDDQDAKAAARKLVRDGLLSKWQAGILLTGRSALRMGKYSLVERLEKSNLGELFLAKPDDKKESQVALKTLSRSLTKDQDRLKGFLETTSAIAKLEHGNLIRLLDTTHEGNRYFLVTEHFDGRDLQTKVEKKGPLSSEQVAKVLRQAADGLAHSHEHSVVHGGINPSNLLADKQDVIKVVNLGLSQLADREEAYQAPEQTAGGEVDHRADIFSLGCTGMYLLTGKVPNNEVKPKSKLEQILLKMMAADVDKRFQKAGDVATLLQKWLDQNQSAQSKSSEEGKPATAKKPLKKAVALTDEPEAVEAEADDLAVSPFAIDAKAKRKPSPQPDSPAIETKAPEEKKARKKAEKNEPVAAAEDDDVKATPAAAGGKKLSRGKLIGIGGGGVLLVVGVIVGLIMILGGGDEQVASTDTETKTEQPAAAAAPAPVEWDPEMGPRPTELVTTDVPPEIPNAESATSDAPATDGASDPGVPSTDPVAMVAQGDPATVPMDTETKDGSSEPTNTEPEQAPTEPDQPPTEPETAPTDPDKAPADPATPPPSETEPAPMPAEPPKAATPPPKPKVNPFGKLAAALELPALESSGEAVAPTSRVELGDLELAELEIFTAKLEGGEQACSSRQTISMRNADRGLAERAFEIYLDPSSAANGGELMIAKWGIENKKLWFEWTSNAQRDLAANYLRNCLLAMATGTETHLLSLRTPAQMEPLVINLESAAGSEATARMDYLPQSDYISVEVSLPEKFPPHRLETQQLTLSGTESSTKLLVGDAGQEVLYFYIKNVMKGKSALEVTVDPKLYPQAPKMTIFKKSDFDKETEVLKQAISFAPRQLELYDAQLKEADKIKNQEQKKLAQGAIKQQKLQYESQLQLAKSQLVARDKLAKFITEMNGAAIQVRVVYRAGDYQVDLARTN